MLRQEQRDCPDAAIGVDHCLVPGQACVLYGFAVQNLGLGRVDLVEGTGRDGELHIADVVINDVSAPQHAGVAAEDYVGPLGVDVLADALHLRQRPEDAADPGIQMRDIAAVRDQDQHHFASAEGFLHHDMAKEAASGFFIVSCDPQVSADAFYSSNDRVVILMLD
ncbi:hypothetical protein D3C75_970080 [compost metagenome]